MASGSRERKVIASVACPVCGAAIGAGCRLTANERALSRGRLLVHGARRTAWQAWRRAQPVEITSRQLGELIAHSDAAYQAILDAYPGAVPIDGVPRGLRILTDHMPEVTRRLIESGWVIGRPGDPP